MKKKLAMLLIMLLVTLSSSTQLLYVAERQARFIEEYNGQLWENRVADESIPLCYGLTVVCLILVGIAIRMEVLKGYLSIPIHAAIIIIAVCSIWASVWMFQMHANKEIIGHSEWVAHRQQSGQQNPLY